jgi:tetratricopeptide (TPR) repeat protein
MSARFLRPRALAQAITAACMLVAAQAGAQTPVAPAAPPASSPDDEPITRSALDAPLLQQLLLGELELNNGNAAAAYQLIFDAARRTRDEQLFRRSVQVALMAESTNRAMEAVRAWRTANPLSRDALQMNLQLLLGQRMWVESVEPLQALIRITPAPERNGAIGSLPGLFARNTDKQQAAQVLERVLQEPMQARETRAASLAALGRTVFAAGDAPRALELARQALAHETTSEAGALLALELLATQPAAETLVQGFLQAAPQNVSMRLVYARVLSGAQRYADAAKVLQDVTRLEPERAAPWLTLGALELELKHPKEAQIALLRYVDLVQKTASTPSAAPTAPGVASAEGDGDDADDAVSTSPDQGLTQAYLLLARLAEGQRDFAAAESWLAKVTNPDRALEVQSRRALLMAKQGKVKEARELIRRVPEKAPEDARAKLVAEAHVLRDVKRWAEASAVLTKANQQFPDDVDLLYEQSMVAEKLNRMDEMERLLRRVIELKPDYHHAYNALGYSLADRNQRLPEARQLIRKALELAPGEPFITDSLGWVEFRLGNRDEALKLLQQAYRSRPDVEIAAHLGEVLWSLGQRDEARRVWREAQQREASNDVLRETLTRLKVNL